MPDPRYRQIAEDLRRKMESGEFGHGAQLPTELELREQYDASRNTVRDAVKWLISRGLVVTRPGHGTFVVEKIDPFVINFDIELGFGAEAGTVFYQSEVQAGRRKATVDPPRVEIQQATGVVASELGLPAGANVVSRHQPRRIDDTPWSLQTTFYPLTYVERGAVALLAAVDMPEGAAAYLEKAIGIKQVGWRDKITVRAADQTETAFFRLHDDSSVAVFENHRTSYDESGQPLRLTVTTYPADRNQFVVSSGQVPPENPAGDAASTERGDTS
jgi:GntR family transcriptional regulator